VHISTFRVGSPTKSVFNCEYHISVEFIPLNILQEDYTEKHELWK